MSQGVLSRREILIIFSGLILVMLLGALDSTIVATALPTIVGELGGLQRLGWVVTAYLLAQTVVTPIYGKLGDLYGRKVVLQTGIVIFLIGSALCGLSGSMLQLIIFRVLQGLGGGGLIVTTQAVVGDIVPPRERGRYQGIFGAVFGVSSIAGPLLGGYFTTRLSWRWIFYINLPLGLLALLVIGLTLPRRSERVRHSIDYLGAILLAVVLSAVVLLTDLAEVSPTGLIVGLGLLALLALAAFIHVERRAVEPILPLRLFRGQTFSIAAAIALIVGFALFGSVIYIPLFLQVVNGASPTGSGLQMLPLMGGMLLTSITSGQLISRWGRYKVFPVAGTAVMTIGLFLLSRMNAGTTVMVASIYMLVLGLGLGLVMQVLVIAVQNVVDYEDLGVATSGATLFRLIGGSLGTAIFGSIFAARLGSYLARALPMGPALGPGVSPETLLQLPESVRAVYVSGFTTSLSTVFLIAAVIVLAGFGLSWLLPERPLRETVATLAGDLGREAEGVFPLPVDDRSLSKLERALSLHLSRSQRRHYVEEVTELAGVGLTPLAAWLLVRFEDDPGLELAGLAGEYAIEGRRLRGAWDELLECGAVRGSPESGTRTLWELTDPGHELLAQLGEARRGYLARIIGEWQPHDQNALALNLGWVLDGELSGDRPPPG